MNMMWRIFIDYKTKTNIKINMKRAYIEINNRVIDTYCGDKCSLGRNNRTLAELVLMLRLRPLAFVFVGPV